MTWDEFKKAVEAAGVQGSDKIDYIDVSVPDNLIVHVSQDSPTDPRHVSIID